MVIMRIFFELTSFSFPSNLSNLKKHKHKQKKTITRHVTYLPSCHYSYILQIICNKPSTEIANIVDK